MSGMAAYLHTVLRTDRKRATARSSRSPSTRRMAAAAVVATVFTSCPPLTVPAVAATPPHYSYSGTAYGTKVSVGSVVKSGPSGLLSLGCTTDGQIHRTNSAVGTSNSALATNGSVSTTADTSAAPIQSKLSSTTPQVSLLRGVVSAVSVRAVSSTTRTSTGYSVSSAGTNFSGLIVAGKPIPSTTAANTRINLAGFGYLVVNEQIRRTNGLTVNGLHLVVTTTNRLGIAVGSDVVVSSAFSALSGPVAGVLGGHAYGTRVASGTTVVSGPSFVLSLPCLGTNGGLVDNTGAGISLGSTLRSGTIHNTVQGTVTTTTARGETTASVQAVDLLNGLVKANGIKADARASTNGSTYGFRDTGSAFGSLTVSGRPGLNAGVAANTTVSLPGVGTLYLRRVIRTPRSIEVRMIELVLSNAVNGLAAGTTISVAVAKATAG
ncbi:MAG TPA: choice-of-anchor P family protein [Propionibacteriaceae bacterium]|nr:choice-of-anchor P family protein [Propionibacteriaceae bacterium]